MEACFRPLQGRPAFKCARLPRRALHSHAATANPAYEPEQHRPQPGLAEVVTRKLGHACNGAVKSVRAWAAQQAAAVQAFSADEEKVASSRRWWQQARTLAMVIPFAAITGEQDAFLLLTKSVCQFVKLYLLLLFVRVILTWFPTFNWDVQPWLALRQVTDPYLNLFQGLVPPLLGAIDLTPLVGFMLLQLLAGYLDTSDEGIEEFW